MNKLTILILTLCFGLNSCAQSTGEEAYINDPDGYTNVRDEQSNSSNIVTTIKTGELFNFQPSDQSNWWSVTKKDRTTGFVHNSRIVSLSTKTAEISKFFNSVRTANPNDVEFGEGSNELIYILAQQFPKAFILAFHNSNEEIQKLIVDEIETPIHDMLDFKLTYQQIKQVGSELSSTTKILDAIKSAGNSLKIDVTE